MVIKKRFLLLLSMCLILTLLLTVGIVNQVGSINLASAEDSYTVKFLNYDLTTYDTQSVVSGETVVKPNDPIDIENFTFIGWSNSSSKYMPFDFTTPITDDENIYAYYYVNITSEPSVDNSCTVSVPAVGTITYQWYKANLEDEVWLDYYIYDDEDGAFYIDYSSDCICLIAGEYEYDNYNEYDVIYSSDDYEVFLMPSFSVNSCTYEFYCENNIKLTNDNCIDEGISYGTLEVIDEVEGYDMYRYTCTQVDGSYLFYLTSTKDFNINTVVCYYKYDMEKQGFTSNRFAESLDASDPEDDEPLYYTSGQYYCVINVDDRYAGQSKIVNFYDVNFYYGEVGSYPDSYYVCIEDTKISSILDDEDGIVTKKQIYKDGSLIDFDEEARLKEDLDICLTYTLEDKEYDLTNALIGSLEEYSYTSYANYKVLPTGKYTLTEDITLTSTKTYDEYGNSKFTTYETLVIEGGSVVEIYLNGHVINCVNVSSVIYNMGNLKVYGGDVKTDYYFDFETNDWDYIETPSNEEKDVAISLDDYDPFEASEMDNKIIKVSGYGLITDGSGAIYNVYGNAYFEDVLFIGQYAYDSAVIGNNYTNLYFKDCEFYGNKADHIGGVVWAKGDITFDSCTLKYNYAGSYGGGVYTTDYIVTVKGNTVILENVANGNLSNFMRNSFDGYLFVDDDFNGKIGVGTGISRFGYGNVDKSEYFTSDKEGYAAYAYMENDGYYYFSIAPVYQVSFVTYDENVTIDPISVISGVGFSKPTEIPQKEGYTFIGWSEFDDYNELFLFEYGVYENTVLYAMFEIKFKQPSVDNDYTVVIDKKIAEDAGVTYQWYQENACEIVNVNEDNKVVESDEDGTYVYIYSGEKELVYVSMGEIQDNEVSAIEYYGAYYICLYPCLTINDGTYVEFTYTGEEELTQDAFTMYYFSGYTYETGTLENLGNNRYKVAINIDYSRYMYYFYICLNNQFVISDVVFNMYYDISLEGKDSASLGKVENAGNYYCKIYYDSYFDTYSDTVITYKMKFYDEKDSQTYNEKLIYYGQDIYDDSLIPTKKDYIFDGWYTKTDDGDVKVESTDIVESVFAKWTEKKTFTLDEKYLTQTYKYTGDGHPFSLEDEVFKDFSKEVEDEYGQGTTKFITVGTWKGTITRPEDDEYKEYTATVYVVIEKAQNAITYTLDGRIVTDKKAKSGTVDVKYFKGDSIITDDTFMTIHECTLVLTSLDDDNYYSQTIEIPFVHTDYEFLGYKWNEDYTLCTAEKFCKTCQLCFLTEATMNFYVTKTGGCDVVATFEEGSGYETQTYHKDTGNKGLNVDTEIISESISNAVVSITNGNVSGGVSFKVSDYSTPIAEVQISQTVTNNKQSTVQNAWNIQSEGLEEDDKGSMEIIVSMTITSNALNSAKSWDVIIVKNDGTQVLAKGATLDGNVLSFSATGDAASVLFVTYNDDTDSVEDDKLSGGAIAGIVIGSSIGAGALGAAIYICILRKKKLAAKKIIE